MLNRRDLLKRIAALGLVAAAEPIQRFIPLDQTMIPSAAPTYTVAYGQGGVESVWTGLNEEMAQHLIRIVLDRDEHGRELGYAVIGGQSYPLQSFDMSFANSIDTPPTTAGSLRLLDDPDTEHAFIVSRNQETKIKQTSLGLAPSSGRSRFTPSRGCNDS